MGTSNAVVIEAVSSVPAPSQSKRQYRSLEQKREIVAETLVVGASVARVARAHGVNANQVFQWRRLYEAGRLGPRTTGGTRLLPVSVSEANEGCSARRTVAAAGLPGHTGTNRTAATGSMDLELRRGRVRIEGPIDPAALRVVLECLRG